MQYFPKTPAEMVASFWRNRQLIYQMTKREVVGRYRGSIIGLAWSFFNPIMMLAIYTFVFSFVFKARWGVMHDEGKADFAIILFVGMILHGLLAECVNRAPTLVLSNPNLVKKVVFPLEIMPWVALGSSLFHSLISLSVLLFCQVLINGYVPLTAFFIPLIFVPLMFASLGLAWFLSALGVYLRDVSQITSMFTTMLLFVSAVFFPITALPEKYQIWLHFNPLAFLIEEGRKILIFGQMPNFSGWIWVLMLGIVIAWGGFAWFQKIRKGFSDVL